MTCLALGARLPRTPATQAPALAFERPDQRFPILYAGETVTVPWAVARVRTFAPLFGADRPSVNPAPPRLVARGASGGTLAFDVPGEYYLRFPGGAALKVVVLDPEAPISDAVERLFDFCVANVLACDGQDHLYSADPAGFVGEWFRSDGPAMLLCGPTWGLFRHLIEDRLALPTRAVTFPGTGRASDGTIVRTTHNMIEVYLPDLDKWVLFDIHNGFQVRWLGAAEICAHVREAAVGDQVLTNEQWQAIEWDERRDAPVPCAAAEASPGVSRFHRRLVTTRTADASRGALSLCFIGGPAYWNAPGTGTEFLPARYNFACMHEDPALAEAAVEWVKSYGVEIQVFTLEEIELALEEGHRALIEAQPWLERLPARMLPPHADQADAGRMAPLPATG